MEAASVMLFGIKRLFAKSLVLPAGMYPMGMELFVFHYSGNHLIKSPVSAAAYDKIYFGFVFFGFLVGIVLVSVWNR